MNKKIPIIMVFAAFFFGNAVFAQQPVNVLVLPFSVHSDENRTSLRTEIPKMIKQQLKREGAKISDADGPSVSTSGAPGIDEIKNIGIKEGADFVVWGSLTLLGPKYSLDAKLLETAAGGPPAVFFEQGENIEGLFGTVRDLADNISVKIFKRVRIDRIVIEGNNRIEDDAVKRFIKSLPGDVFSSEKLSEDLKAIYGMGYFEDVRVESQDGPKGKTIIFHVTEKPTVRKISFKGNRVVKEDKINKGMTISTGSILNVIKIQENIKSIESLYKEENYHNVNVTYEIRDVGNNQTDIEFIIEEGKKQQIDKITFEGNVSFSEKELKSIMKTSEKGFFSWITSSGQYDAEDLNQDVAKLTAFYMNNGYVQARASDPELEFKDQWIHVHIKISEGKRFKVGRVGVAGDIILTEKDLMDKLKITKEEFFNRQVLQQDVMALTDLYSDEGYAYPDVSPRVDQDTKNLIVNITYDIKKGNRAYFEKINIHGNTKTRDKVIRRELTVYENDLYSGKRLKRSVRNLYRLDFFEDIKVDPTKGSADDKMVLDISVKEKPTGSFSFGAGYSSVENVFGMVQLAQRNLFGRGQELQLKAEVGGTSTRYTLGFTEPWLFDIPLSAGVDVYNWTVDYDEYDRDSVGGSLKFGYPVFDYTRVYIGYSYDVSDITNVDPEAAFEIRDLEGINTTSMISTSLRYDSRDRVFNPTDGSNHGITVEYAGLGGNIGYIKYSAETGWYFPFYKNLTLFTHGETGYIHKNLGKKVPDYERFYLGGMNSVRGFKWRDISSHDNEGNKIGGDKYLQFNVELLYPILKEAGFVGLVFFDTGDVYSGNENVDMAGLRESAGLGLRWYSPMGPLRIEYGRILDRKAGESTGRWEFSVGQAF
jgi:outer membrane protein insertion porin family